MRNPMNSAQEIVNNPKLLLITQYCVLLRVERQLLCNKIV